MKLFAQKDAEAFARTGARELRHNRELRLTPGARDVLVEAGIKIVFDAAAGGGASVLPAVGSGPAAAGGGARAAGAAGGGVALFAGDEAARVKREICDIGHRIWLREYCDGNGGNISYRIGPNEVLCTPTLVSKGFLKPEMICMVDLEGKQVAGTFKKTSEITTHLAIYKTTPEARAVVHAHPVHATAFAIAGFEPPGCLIPELEVFVGKVPVAPYETPGSPELAAEIGKLAPDHPSIMMGNHGLICWGTGVEDAYFKMEITDAYCRTLVVASHLPGKRTSITGEKMAELLDLKKRLGMPDVRADLHPVQLCEVDPWARLENRPCGCSSPAGPGGGGDATPAEIEQLVQQLTDEIVKKLPPA